MGFNQTNIIPEEWKVVKAVAQLIRKNPHWLAKFKGNRTENRRIIEWDLRQVGLTSLPENFGNLKEALNLNLGVNEIRILPPSFGQLRKLEYLTINSNVIFPPECKGLINLKQLDTRDIGQLGGTYIASKGDMKHLLLDKMEEGYFVHRLNRGIEYLKIEEVKNIVEELTTRKSERKTTD